MKKMMMAVLILLSATVYASGGGKKGKETEKENHLSVTQVPSWVVAQFYALFPMALNVKWESETEHGVVQYKATFYLNGQKMKARF